MARIYATSLKFCVAIEGDNKANPTLCGGYVLNASAELSGLILC